MTEKRKIIRQGNNTLTITLPREWTSSYDVKQGDEISLDIKGNCITLCAEKLMISEKKSKDISRLTSLLPFMLLAFYRKGYDEVCLNFEREQTLVAIQNILHYNASGYNIVEDSKTSCTLKLFSEVKDLDFNEMLRKLFLLLKLKLEKICSSVSGKNTIDLQSVAVMNSMPPRYTSICHRLIAKRNLADLESLPQLYIIISKLESLDNQLNLLIQQLLTSGTTINSNELSELLHDFAEIYFEFYDSFYDKDSEHMMKVINRKNLMQERFNAFVDDISNHESMLLLSLNNSFIHFDDIVNAALIMKL